MQGRPRGEAQDERQARDRSLPRGSQGQVLRPGSLRLGRGYSFSSNTQLVDSMSGDTIT